MKKNILAAVRTFAADDYFNYMAFLGRDFKLPLKFVLTTPPVNVSSNPVAIVGGGIEEPPQVISEKAIEQNRQNIEDIIERLTSIHPDISYDLTEGYIGDRINDEELNKTALMWSINRTSDDNFFNRVFGTVETDFSKSGQLPCLSIPANYKYSKPKNILFVVRNTGELKLTDIDQVLERFDLQPTFAFHEDDKNLDVNEIMRVVNNGLDTFSGPVKTTLLSDESEIEETLNEENPDWISFINYERPFFERIFKENSNHLILKYDKPIISFK